MALASDTRREGGRLLVLSVSLDKSLPVPILSLPVWRVRGSPVREWGSQRSPVLWELGE